MKVFMLSLFCLKFCLITGTIWSNYETDMDFNSYDIRNWRIEDRFKYIKYDYKVNAF